MSAARALSTASERTYAGLRNFNLVMGFLHLIQGILMIVRQPTDHLSDLHQLPAASTSPPGR